MFDLSVQQKYFDAIKADKKDIEGRLAKDKYRHLQVGSPIIFYNNERTMQIEKQIVSLRIYKSFRDAFKYEDFKKAVPDAKNIDDAVAVYEAFYPEEEQLKFGVIIIKLA